MRMGWVEGKIAGGGKRKAGKVNAGDGGADHGDQKPVTESSVPQHKEPVNK